MLTFRFVGRSNRLCRCLGKKAGAEAKKGPEKPFQSPPLFFRKETRGERNSRSETAEARLRKRESTAFFGEANVFLPGHEAISP